jgi:hypothetical protein
VPSKFGDKCLDGGVLKPGLYLWLLDMKSSPSLLLLTTAWLGDEDNAGNPAGDLPTHRLLVFEPHTHHMMLSIYYSSFVHTFLISSTYSVLDFQYRCH